MPVRGSLKYKPCDPVFIENNLDQRNRYKCPECGYLLENAVQTSCGHWFCQDCAKNVFERSSNPVCPRVDCGEKLEIDDGNKYFPDKFVRRQINRFQTRCCNHVNDCMWTGTFIELVKHLETCIYEREECPHCSEMINMDELKAHERKCPKSLVTCPFVQHGCEITKQMTRAECDKHLETEVANHLKFVVALLPPVNKEKYSTEDYDWPSEDSKFKTFFSDFGGHLDPREVNAHQPDESCIMDFNHGCPRLNDPQVQINGPNIMGETKVGDVHDKLETCVEPEILPLKKQLAAKESQIRHLQDKLQQIETTILTKTTENEDRDFRLSLMENSNYDGTMVWKIPQFTQRKEDARTGKYTSIFSLPFYSGRYGYKMCLRLYILGDGIGKGSHMSLFFVLMKGEFDSILQWPFTHKVTFKLINQCGGRDVVDTFQPDPLSSSFQKPKTDMNIASGCPRFVSLNELMQNGFIVDDTVFIKVKIHTTTMKNP